MRKIRLSRSGVFLDLGFLRAIMTLQLEIKTNTDWEVYKWKTVFMYASLLMK